MMEEPISHLKHKTHNSRNSNKFAVLINDIIYSHRAYCVNL